MGRKPNPIIQRFFERGAKLGDSSNRYQHTCKRCGEKFEKGRQETLVVHVTKKCHVISQDEREKFLHDITFSTPASIPIKVHGRVHSPSPPSQHHLSGLDALAEVSRQHGHIDYNLHQSTITDEFFNTDHNGDAIAREHSSPLPASMPHGHATPMVPMSSTASLRMAEAALNALDPQLSSLPDRRASQEQNRDQRVLVNYSDGQPLTVDNYRSRHSLSFVHDESPEIEESRAAALPADHVQVIQAVSPTSAQHAQIQTTAFDARVPSQDMNFHEQMQESAQASVVESLGEGLHQWDAYNSAPIIQAKKVRGAFAPDRRTAVKEVRKKGACLRCRMLKKSCDAGDPCKECAKLDNARLWKGACLRTRLTQMFELFSSGLFLVIAHHEVEAVKHGALMGVMPGRLEVSHFPQSGIAMTFPYVKVSSLEEDTTSIISTNILINTEHEGFGPKLTFGGRINYYSSRLLERHRETGGDVFKTSKFMKETVYLAMNMSGRYLVTQALELWVCTELISCKPSDLRAFIHSSLPSSAAAAEFTNSGGSHIPAAIDIIFFLQLRRATEKCADILFKTVMIELEKSLIQRKSSDNFETFIGTILLLRCVERMCYLYKSFDVLLEAPHQNNFDLGDLPNPNRTPSWPLEKPPSQFWKQGEQFSDLLAGMLRLRKVPPDIEVTDGVLRATHDQPENIQRYFDAIELHVTDLEEAFARPVDEVDGNAWELRLLGKVFEKTHGCLSKDGGS